MSKDTFIFRLSWMEAMSGLDEEIQREVCRAIPIYAATGEVPEMGTIAKAVFGFIKSDMDRDSQKYTETVSRRAEAGRRSGEQRRGTQKVATNEQNEQVFDLLNKDEQNEQVFDLLNKDEQNEQVFDLLNKKNSCSQKRTKRTNVHFVQQDEKHTYSRRDNDSDCDSEYDSDSVEKEKNSFSSSPNPMQGLPEEKQQERFLLERFFFGNYEAPECEVRKFLAFNRTGGRDWDRMTEKERASCLELWSQKDASGKAIPPGRFSGDFLTMWREAYDIAARNGAPQEIAGDMLSDGIRCKATKGAAFELWLPKRLYEFIERNLDTLKPVIWPFIQSSGCTRLQYHFTTE